MNRYEIDYGVKRPLIFEPYDMRDHWRKALYIKIDDYIRGNVRADTLVGYDLAQRCRRIEKVAIEICMAYSPMRNYGIKKSEIRTAIDHIFKLMECEHLASSDGDSAHIAVSAESNAD
ncbi:hypothetical protein [Paenibacillus humicus]|uniref:hypothetical protein n=1 Tax=Paenibacillus humicus TaxID=412861 RepID=UPI000FDA7C47|nr:hypothetical protein [Paenibacillus humicus]